MEASAETNPKYTIDIEGSLYSWHRRTITVPELRELAGIEPSQQMIEVDLKHNTERTLAEDEVIELKAGHGFAKKIRYKRG
jgi:Multiubiquitin